jgi:hypothetical protein
MNSQELRALQESYSQVYELDEVLDTPQKTQSYAAKNAASAVGAFVRGDTKTLSKRFEGSKRGMKKIEKRKEQKEQADLYDIILSHLLDEGYADTEQAAEAIMVNMSEDWRESICEGYVELNKKRQRRMTDSAMRKMDSDKWEQAYSIENERDTQTPEVSQAKAAANKKRGEEKRRG